MFLYIRQSEHNPSHIHALYGEDMAAINDLDISCDELYENGIIACEKTCDFQK